VFSFYVDGVHYNIVVKLLNDRFGIQTRGGCSCAGTYGHFLLNVNKSTSKAIEQKILDGCLIERPGWVRMSIHPTMTNKEIDFICGAIDAVAKNYKAWEEDYEYNARKNEFEHKSHPKIEHKITNSWFKM
jgi:selenocysteine lyase/cysteine desulfurase